MHPAEPIRFTGLSTDANPGFMVQRAFAPMLDLRNSQRRVPAPAAATAAERAYPPVPGLADEAFVVQGALVTRTTVWLDDQPLRGTFGWWNAKNDAVASRRAGEAIRRTDPASVPTIPGRCAVIHKPGLENYFHWNVEILPRLNLLAPLLRDGSLDRVYVYFGELPGFARASIAFFFPDLRDRVLGLPAAVTRFESLVYFVNALEGLGLAVPTCISAAGHQWMRTMDERLDRLLPRAARRPMGEYLYVSRDDASGRRLLNEQDLLARLHPGRWQRIVCSGLSVAEQIAAFRRARVVVGPHGAGLTNVMFCRPGTRFIELNCRNFISRYHYFCDIADQRALDYRLILLDQRRIPPALQLDLYLAPSQLRRLVALLRAA